MTTQTIESKKGLGVAVSALGQLSDEELIGILDNALAKYSYPYLVYQTLTQYEITTFPKDFDGAAVFEARAFGPDGELRWKRETWQHESSQHQGWRIVYLGRMENCPDRLSPGMQNLAEYDLDEETRVSLRGEKKAGQKAWYDLRIPKPLHYPLETGKEVALRLNIFRVNGRVEFTQWADLQAAH